MSSEGHSTYSYEKSTASLLNGAPTRGTHKVKYQGDSEWDFQIDGVDVPVDLSLNLPHYRARHQPVDHRMSMFIGGEREPIKLKVCRTVSSRSRFYLEIQADASDVTVWLPSDFKGQIHYGGKASFSAGFVNRIMRNVRFNEPVEKIEQDGVVVVTRGHVTFRMWDMETGAPENGTKEQLKRFFGCTRKAPTNAIDWDFLVRD
ncbi:hypothetical protein CC1G_11518 [Coprinopsis cinerea okayama7|uniref:DUF7330 domain-containing protein n=1 Tax=Coprinopsis cinerea (strain Okayama-7 / 130 / ATCC MYA-4618 / FGSC 9003) TaxID=240176 RepID=A8NHB9_COPC7|nr:hypothetical protein CC1G_11518 [Coprinopsis cinerea okayama7\|eukprot:XP_001833733.1 hypothetical protein CC1G_11518 [Coprinopsis cinerea okayama7\